MGEQRRRTTNGPRRATGTPTEGERSWTNHLRQPPAHLARRLHRLRALASQIAAALFEADSLDPALAPLLQNVRRVWQEKAAGWWTRPTTPLGGRAPRDVAIEGAEGRALVDMLIGHIEHGIAV
jgi:hypothetical protein